MKYPKLDSWVSIKQVEQDKFLIQGPKQLVEERIIDEKMADFMMSCLDGKTNPYVYAGTVSEKQVYEWLTCLEEWDLIRKSRFMKVGIGSFICTVWEPKTKEKSSNRVATVADRCLMFMSVPILLIGIYMFSHCGTSNYSFNQDIAGFIIGTVIGLIVHELGHAISGVAHGAKVYELGIGLMWFFLPRGYTFMDLDTCPRSSRLQIFLAGPAVNALCAGICYILAVLIPRLSCYFSNFAYMNVLLCLSNLLPIDGLDGSKIYLSGVGGTLESDDDLKILIYSKDQRDEGIVGNAQFLFAIHYLLSQVLLVGCFLILEGRVIYDIIISLL